MKSIRIEEKNTKEFKNIINEIIKQKGHTLNMNVRCRGKNLKTGIVWNFDCCKEIKDSRGKNDGIICRYLTLNDIGEKKILYSDYVNFQRTNLIDSILS